MNEDGVDAVLPAVLAVSAEPAISRNQALAACGGRICAVDWSEVVERMNLQAHDPIILLDGQGAADEMLTAALYRVDAIASARDLKVIAGCSISQVDIFSAGLIHSNAQLLIAPSVADWIAALSVAQMAGPKDVLYDRIREGEAARLAKLNEEVARITEVLSRLSRNADEPRRGSARTATDSRPGLDGAPAVATVRPDDVRKIIRGRRLRDRFFGQGVFEDPAWDMILDLFAAHLERGQVSVSSLCIASAVAPTTALRWITKLSDAGLFERQPDPFDRRRAYVALSPRALDGMNRYVLAARDAGLPIA